MLIAIEGIDGSGKGTQSQRLHDRLRQSDVRATLLSFPRYDATFFGRAVGEYLNGRFGSLDQVHPFLVSLLFAADRLESRPQVTEALAAYDVVVLDRYVASNVAHQAAKASGAERDELCRSIEHIEFGVFGMPKPDMTILLDLSVPLAQQLIARKARRTYTERAADIQESDGDYLARVRELYLKLAETEPNWTVVRCDARGDVRSIDEVAEEVWNVVAARRTRDG